MLWRVPVDTVSVAAPSWCVCVAAANRMPGWCSRRWWWQLLPAVLSVLLDVPESWTMEFTGLEILGGKYFTMLLCICSNWTVEFSGLI